MNETKCKQMHRYFQSVKQECQEEISRLQLDHRVDEAVLAKIRLNIYDIFHSVFSVAEKTQGDDEKKLSAFFLDRLERIPLSWKTALEKAKQYGNVETAYIETIKLETVTQIYNVFHRVWEGE